MLTWERSDGWPRQTARLTGLLGLLWLSGALAIGAASGMLALAGLTLFLGILLALWRRGVTLDRERSTLTRWYGVTTCWGAWHLRHLESLSLSGFEQVTVEQAGEHFKRWPEMYRVVLRREGALERLVVDDEYPSLAPAQTRASQVAAFLGLQGPANP